MRNNLYIYQNKTDMIEFSHFLRTNDIELYSYYGEPLDIGDYQYHNGRELFYIANERPISIQKNKRYIAEGMDCIEVSTPYETGDSLQSGGIFLFCKNENAYLRSIFKTIKKFIQTNYTISDNKHYYVGPSISRDWFMGKIEFPDLFKRKEIVVTSDVFSLIDFADYIQKKGYILEENGKDIRNLMELNFHANDYIICKDDMSLIKTVRARRLYFQTGSECIFLSIKSKSSKMEYTFQMDARLDTEKHDEIRELFYIIHNYIQ